MFWNYDDIFSLSAETLEEGSKDKIIYLKVNFIIQQMSVFSSHAWPASRQIYFP